LGGLLAPLSQIQSNVGPFGGSEFGGLIPGLLSFGPELAALINPLG
jgi:hypothetical protein